MPKMLYIWQKHMIYDLCKTVLPYYCVTVIYDIMLNKSRNAMLLWNELHVSREINHVLHANKKLQTHRSYICCKDMEKM
jgi:hypothetical protein